MSCTTTMSQKERIFLDSSVIIGLFTGDDAAEEILARVIDHSPVINDIVFSEVVYKSMILKFLETEGTFNLKKFKRNIGKYVHLYKEFCEFCDDFDIDFLVITNEVTKVAGSLAAHYNLLPNDALIAATCKHYGIGKMASFDPDFMRIDFLEIVE